jgi:ubiquinone/menaquinone biosynthesis C-methylase UbiE
MAALDMSTPYSPTYAAIYDYLIAPAVVAVSVGDIQRLVDRAAPHSRILDVGCGGGQHVVSVAQTRPDLQLVALDLSHVFLRHAHKRAREAGVEARVQLVHGTATALPFPDEAFDHVYSTGSIKHWVDLKRGLDECWRVLKPGGQLLVMEADRGCRFEDVVTWASQTRLPKLFQPVLHAYFRMIVTGQSIDLQDASRLWSEMTLVDKEAPRRIPNTPALVMSGRKPG